ncbi:MAG: PH domain-containing protein, partial [Pseudomonadota bacterium]
QIFVPSLMICILYVAVWAILFFMGQATFGTGRLFIITMAIITPLLAAWAFLKYQTIRLQVSDGHLYIHPGWPREMPIDIPREMVETVSVQRGLIGRIFGGGTLVITMTDGRAFVLRDLSHPEEAETTVMTSH